MKVYWLQNSELYHKKGCSHIEGRSDLLSGEVEDALIAGKKPCRSCFKRDFQSVHNAVLSADGVVYNSSLRKYDQIRWVYHRFPKEFQKTVLLYRHLKKTLDDETADNDLLQFFRIHSYTSISDDSYKCMEAYFGIMNKPIAHDITWFNEQLKSASAGQKPVKQNVPIKSNRTPTSNSQPPAKSNKPAVIEAEYTVKQTVPTKQQNRVSTEPSKNYNGIKQQEQKPNKFTQGLISLVKGIFQLIWGFIVLCVGSWVVGGALMAVVYLGGKILYPERDTPVVKTPKQQETSSVKQQVVTEPEFYTSRTYDVYCRVEEQYNNSVGSDWRYDNLNIQVNGVDMGASGITLNEGDYVYPNVLVYEYDDGGNDTAWASPESGFYITSDDLQGGFNLTITDIIIVEDHGRYAGNTASVNAVFNFAPRD